MYYLDDPRQPSEHVVERAKHCSAVKIGPGEYRVTPMTYGFPDHHGKDKRHVKFGEDKFGVYATCVDYYDRTECPANANGRRCCHVHAAMKSVARAERRAA